LYLPHTYPSAHLSSPRRLTLFPYSTLFRSCSRRFAAESHVHCYLNDGRSLSMIPDASVDFVFSFDSFVHLPREIVEGYLNELRRDRKSTRLNSSHGSISYSVFCL